MKIKAQYKRKTLGKIPADLDWEDKGWTDWYNDKFGTSARNVDVIGLTDDSISFEITDVPALRVKSTKGLIKTFSMNRPNMKIVEAIKAKFNTPDDFVYNYNAYMMGRLKDESMEDWFNKLPEDELDKANEYYLTNTRIKKFSRELQAIKRKCKTKEQKLAFNALYNEFMK